MAIVTGDEYLESLVKFVENHAEKVIEGTLALRLNPMGLRYVQSRLEARAELESLSAGAPVDYLRAYVSNLGDHRALEQLRRILCLLPSLKLVSALASPARDPTPLCLLPFGRLKVLELRGCDLSTSAARGLLELRFSLEKLICHNSTDALRHVFASRIAEIKDSHQWNRLSFVSCACNGLVLMDESLQLLPAVETLDLSRNKFSKAINLQKCTKLKHLDLGFNSLRSIESFNEVSCQIVKLVLRNNALTKLHGIEHMKSLEGLDLSYNIISNFSEVEILARLPSLQDLWLEGNPLCCARWFRAQVFSLFSHPQKLKLDEKRISTCELWKRQMIVVSRRKRPSSFGFYSPVKDDTDLVRNIFTKRKRISRVVSFKNEELICSDQDSRSNDNEIHTKSENGISDEEAVVEELMQKIEFMKKEHSVLWLREFKRWMNQTTDNIVDGHLLTRFTLGNSKKFHLEGEKQDKDLGATSRDMLDSIQLSGDESNSNLDYDVPFIDASTAASGHQQFHQIAEVASESYMFHVVRETPVSKQLDVGREEPRTLNSELCGSSDAGNIHCTQLALRIGGNMNAKNATLTTATNDTTGSSSALACSGSPPHYQPSVLRHHNSEEKFLQASPETLSAVSSDSHTCCSEEDSAEFGLSISPDDQYVIYSLSPKNVSHKENMCDVYDDTESSMKQNGGHASCHIEGNLGSNEGKELETRSHTCSGSFTNGESDVGIPCFGKEVNEEFKM